MNRRYIIYSQTCENPLEICWSLNEAKQVAKMRGSGLMVISYAFDPERPSAFNDPKFEEVIN